MTMHEKSPQGGRFMKRWGRVLLRPEMRQPQMACDVLESILHGDPGDPVPPAKEIQCACARLWPVYVTLAVLRRHHNCMSCMLAEGMNSTPDLSKYDRSALRLCCRHTN